MFDRAINWALWPFDRQIGRIGASEVPLDLQSLTDDPIEALYRANGRPFVIKVPLARCRGLGYLAFACTKSSGHPLVATAEGCLQGRWDAYSGSVMEQFYRDWTPANAVAIFGLDENSASVKLKSVPAYAAPFIAPWGAVEPNDAARVAAQHWRAENRHHGLDIGPEAGVLISGPFTDLKGQMEFERLRRTVESIRAEGYRRSDSRDGDITGLLMVRADSWVVRVLGGQHRTAALVALEYEQVTLRVPPSVGAVRRFDVESWPSVRSGLFSRSEALHIFDRLFEGQQPFGFAAHNVK